MPSFFREKIIYLKTLEKSKFFITSGLTIGGFILLCCTLVGISKNFLNSKNDFSNFNFTHPISSTQATSQKLNKPTIAVSIVGEIKHPGMYWLPTDSRVQDLIVKAGGLLATSDWKSINLARKLADGEQILVENQHSLVETNLPGKGSEKHSNNFVNSKLVNINTANRMELITLPGIGNSTAEKIINWRKENGNFSTKQQLMEVKGIGTGKFAKLANYITV